MNTWTVGNHPIGHFIHKRRISKESEAPPAYLTEKTFFLKGRIMAGQADIKDNRHFVTDFKWLSKEEIQKHVIPPYWSSIKNMLSER
jgi:large subunit ribosomal protein L46